VEYATASESVDFSMEDGQHRRFYMNVILRAVEEAEGVSLVCGRKEKPSQLKAAARSWLTSDTLDLRFVCERAGVDFEKLLQTYRRKYK